MEEWRVDTEEKEKKDAATTWFFFSCASIASAVVISNGTVLVLTANPRRHLRDASLLPVPRDSHLRDEERRGKKKLFIFYSSRIYAALVIHFETNHQQHRPQKRNMIASFSILNFLKRENRFVALDLRQHRSILVFGGCLVVFLSLSVRIIS